MLDFFEQLGRQINPIPAVLAETFISLNACQKLEGIRFRGCAHLLQVWALSHFWKIPTLVLPNMSSPNFSPLREFLAKEWPEIKRSKWVDIFKDRRYEEIVWRVPWLGRTKILYKCGDYDYLMLLDLRKTPKQWEEDIKQAVAEERERDRREVETYKRMVLDEKDKGKRAAEKSKRAFEGESVTAWKRKAHDCKVRSYELQSVFDATSEKLTQSQAHLDELQTKIHTTITAKTRQDLIKLLQDYHDVFAWS
ncbi:hypothetical protein GQ457_02G023960 [Hibiscus cannabinus]